VDIVEHPIASEPVNEPPNHKAYSGCEDPDHQTNYRAKPSALCHGPYRSEEESSPIPFTFVGLLAFPDLLELLLVVWRKACQIQFQRSTRSSGGHVGSKPTPAFDAQFLIGFGFDATFLAETALR
jgi:hypothetical protein